MDAGINLEEMNFSENGELDPKTLQDDQYLNAICASNRYLRAFKTIDSGQSKRFNLLSSHFGQIAQSVEQRTENPCVGGSIPPLATNKIKYLQKRSNCKVSLCRIYVEELRSSF